MDEKTSLLPQAQPQEDVIVRAHMSRQQRRSRFQVAALVLLFGVFWLARTWTCDQEHNEVDTKVPLDVHIM
jgi:hypothetical protein